MAAIEAAAEATELDLAAELGELGAVTLQTLESGLPAMGGLRSLRLARNELGRDEGAWASVCETLARTSLRRLDLEKCGLRPSHIAGLAGYVRAAGPALAAQFGSWEPAQTPA